MIPVGAAHKSGRVAAAAVALVAAVACMPTAQPDRAHGGEGGALSKGAAQPIGAQLAVLLDAPDAREFRRRARVHGIPLDAYGVRVDIQTRGLVAGDREQFAIDGLRVRTYSPPHERIAASVRDADSLRALAALGVVRRVEVDHGPAPTGGEPAE